MRSLAAAPHDCIFWPRRTKLREMLTTEKGCLSVVIRLVAPLPRCNLVWSSQLRLEPSSHDSTMPRNCRPTGSNESTSTLSAILTTRAIASSRAFSNLSSKCWELWANS
jgi:hypothetical protein